MLEYKCAWYGRELVVVDRFFPSTRLCSAPGCGYVNAKMPLNVREWTCPRCGTVHDRDVNAANNLRAAGLAVAAGPPLCDRGEARTVGEGAGVRPQRESSRTGRSVSKQEGHGATRDGATAPNHR
jgi:putative transposase